MDATHIARNTRFNTIFSAITSYNILKANFRRVIAMSIVLSLFCFITGAFLYVTNKRTFEWEHILNDDCPENRCAIRFELLQDKHGPFYIYIGHRDFHLNHHKVMTSVSFEQTEGFITDIGTLETSCRGYVNAESGSRFFPNKFQYYPPQTLLNPCGLFSLLYTERKFTRQYHDDCD